MNECLKIVNLSILFILLTLYICLIISEIIYLIDKKQVKNIIYYILIIDIVITSISIFITLLLGFLSLYFSSKDKLLIFLIITFIFLLTKILSSIIIYLKEDINFEYSIINIIFCIIISEIVLLILSFILCLIQRNQLIKEIKESPLNYVDEYMTEDIYKIILSRSLNPENKELKNDLIKQLELRKTESSRFSSINSMKSSVNSKEWLFFY